MSAAARGEAAREGSQQPDAQALWQHVFGRERGLLQIWTAARSADGRLIEPKSRNYRYPVAVDEAAQWALQESGGGREVYFCAHLLTGSERRKENAGDVSALWFEKDGGKVPNGPVQASAVVESSPGRYHGYVRLTDAVPPEIAEGLNKRLAHAIGGDPSGADRTQLLRVPGTVNHKYKGRPVVKVIGISDSRVYTPAEVEELLPSIEARERHNAPEVGEAIPTGGRNKTLTSLAGTMRRRGMSGAEILAALQVTNEQRCHPPLGAEEVERIAASVARYEPAGNVVHITANGRGAPLPPERFNLTDLGNAERFIRDHGGDVRYCYAWSRWMGWTGARWERDESGRVHRLAKETVRGIYQEAAEAEDEHQRKALAKHATKSEAEAKIRAMLELAKSEVPVSPDEFDPAPWLLNTPSGTVDLRTGELREHRREDLLTKITGADYDPDAAAPTWAATLERALPSQELRQFFKKLCGYAFSGNVSEHILAVLYGTGANGKSTILNALLAAAGDYGMQAAPDLLVAKKGSHPTEVADLFGMRLVASIEVEDGRRLAESLVKQLTGGDKVRARKMRQDFWQFDPTHKVFMAVNHKPEVRGTDTAIWRRLRLIPFEQTIPPAEQDKKLPQKLEAELPGILAWCVEGCLEWQREGLQAPEEVRKATAGYRSEMDVIGAFLQDECEIRREFKESFTTLYKRYEEWCEDGGERAETRRKFNARLKERGLFEARRSGPGGSNEWHGLRLLKKQNSGFAGKLKQHTEKDYNRPENTSSRENGKNSFSSSVTSVEPTDEQLQRVRELVAQGLSEYAARVEVLAKDHPLDCECGVCSS